MVASRWWWRAVDGNGKWWVVAVGWQVGVQLGRAQPEQPEPSPSFFRAWATISCNLDGLGQIFDARIAIRAGLGQNQWPTRATRTRIQFNILYKLYNI